MVTFEPYSLKYQNLTIEQEQSFDPWGRKRNPTNWSYDNIPEFNLLDRGYTGHCLSRFFIGKHLNEFNLINMNGRLYDPILGRVLSPDPALQMPANTQNYNRYSYCLNNPLKYNDPSGNQMALPTEYRQLGVTRPHYRINDITDNNPAGWGGNGGALPTGSEGGGGGGGDGFYSWIEFWGEVNDLRNSPYGGSSSGLGTTRYFESQPEAFLAGYLYNDYHNSWNQTDGGSRSSAVNAFIELMTINSLTADKKGSAPDPGPGINDPRYPGIQIFYVKGLDKGFTLPGIGIFVGNGDTEAHISHEYGHYLQSLYFGQEIYYNRIIPESLKNMSLYSLGIISNSEYYNTLTEKNANTFSYNYFMEKGGTNQICQVYNRRFFPIYNLNTNEFLLSKVSIYHLGNYIQTTNNQILYPRWWLHD